MTTAERARFIEVIEAHHVFPGLYHLSVVALNTDAVAAAVLAAASEGLVGPLDAHAHEVRLSRGGRYASHRLAIPCRDGADVLSLYDRFRSIEGVITVL